LSLRQIVLFIAFLLFSHNVLWAQYPSYTKITTEEGLPSNEVYSIVQDKKGMIWVGCDAGLFKYDGVRFVHYKNANQKSNSLSGLTLSSSGRIYTYSFKGQLFYIENDSLYELENLYGRITSITCDNKFNLWISHNSGISCFNEKTKKWTDYNEYPKDSLNSFNANSAIMDAEGVIWFNNAKNICSIKDSKISCYHFDFEKEKIEFTTIFLHKHGKGLWIVSRIDGRVYYMDNGKIDLYKSNKLIKILNGRKITSVKEFDDGTIWFFTYSGIVIYNTLVDSVRIISPEFSFSGMIKDREGIYWFSTIQNGILKVPNLDFLVWNSENKALSQDFIYKLHKDDDFIYFSTLNGYYGKINKRSDSLDLKRAKLDGDIQQIYYDKIDKKLYYTLNNALYYSKKGGDDGMINNIFQPIKQMIHTQDGYFMATSLGAYHFNSLEQNHDSISTVSNYWTRSVSYDKHSDLIWMASNNGLLKIKKDSIKRWIVADIFYKDTLIVYACFDALTKQVYSIDYLGNLRGLDTLGKHHILSVLPKLTQPYQLKVNKNNIYIATNKGLWIYNLNDKSIKVLNKQMGLASDNIQNIEIDGNFIWLATGNGLQKIPVNFSLNHSKGIVYIKKILVDGKLITNHDNLKLDYDQSLSFHLEASNYISNGQFKFAYRFKKSDENWFVFPANIEQIDIPNLPYGKHQLEIKLIDFLGEDSENIITLNVFVNPPYWQKWWFYILLIFIVLAISFALFKLRIQSINKKQEKEIERLKLETDLRLMQQSALKAQMNPHFLFNVLNSIKGYIYENDKKNATSYLNDFSELVRKILEFSSLPKVKLSEEVKIIKLYIKLEAMLLQDKFTYDINIHSGLDESYIKIPSLIIQPFVENAFKHGLRNKVGDKHLQINILPEGNVILKIEIIDNGIGREASFKLNILDKSEHKSFALSAVEKRINLLNYEKKGIIGMEIIDLYQDNIASGTKVILRININE